MSQSHHCHGAHHSLAFAIVRRCTGFSSVHRLLNYPGTKTAPPQVLKPPLHTLPQHQHQHQQWVLSKMHFYCRCNQQYSIWGLKVARSWQRQIIWQDMLDTLEAKHNLSNFLTLSIESFPVKVDPALAYHHHNHGHQHNQHNRHHHHHPTLRCWACAPCSWLPAQDNDDHDKDNDNSR